MLMIKIKILKSQKYDNRSRTKTNYSVSDDDLEELEENEPSSTIASEYVPPEDTPKEVPSEEHIEDPEDLVPHSLDRTPHVYGGTPHVYGAPRYVEGTTHVIGGTPHYTETTHYGVPPYPGHIDVVPQYPGKVNTNIEGTHYIDNTHPGLSSGDTRPPEKKPPDTEIRPPVIGVFAPVVPPIPAAIPTVNDSGNIYIRYLTRKSGKLNLLFQVAAGCFDRLIYLAI